VSFRSWLKQEERVWYRIRLIIRGLVVRSTKPERWLLSAIAVLSVVPFIATWINPFLIWYAVSFLGLLMVIAAWRLWLGTGTLVRFIAAVLLLGFFWFSGLTFWLFLENPLYRLVFVFLMTSVSWWYLKWWLQWRLTLLLGSGAVSVTPSLIVGFLTSFFIVTAAESFLIFLGVSGFVLWFIFFAAWLLTIVSLGILQGWSPVWQWRYYVTLLVVAAQVFLLATWLPTSFYVIGFLCAVVLVVLLLGLRQENQGFINRRLLARDLIVITAALLLSLLTARWI